ncbi:hypothetical protein KM031_12860 [Gemmobacter fulvus]|uniref:Uncharacterized protein n=1 Tax=Gemmobacter fulvus TaxID=2840474 RepID=A0A975S0L8_9RHOB|nr:hypothetical protein [Gemmobacter fulvus]MBT9246948.1 hypothetical protein [Gemmobacter fulvus]MDQ1847367.1 hypothetical protein [Gemmobacter fulvus]QWK89722.1 hypothetical protein KM031_12860 [Gemmobacter fulvus]
MRRLILLLPLLAACGTPQEQCISSVTRDQRVVEKLIAETQGNLDRGYAMERYTTYEMDWRNCGRPHHKPGTKPAPPRMCWEEIPVTRTRPKAIDLAAEASKLRQLQDKRAQLSRSAQPAIAQCRAQHPE